jgi:hypothetical protein
MPMPMPCACWGKDENEAVTALSGLTGMAAGVVTVASAGPVDFFALRGELVKWGHDTVRGLRDRVSGVAADAHSP